MDFVCLLFFRKRLGHGIAIQAQELQKVELWVVVVVLEST